MILVELEIEDYKQFAGVHRFTPPEQGIVGIIGPNGAGKTTLFEAIEWCLYNPREIVADEIPPRGRAGRPRVKVVLQDTHEDVRYVIERTQKRGVSNAEIYREDQPEARIVHGPRQVTEYVARKLVGLDHRAFVSTFFTRQKELTFFGNLKETDRRREVGRLLGLETIREAQKLIAEDRAKARAEASALELQHRELSADRDFAAETARAESLLDVQAAEVTAAEDALAAARAAHTSARDRLAALQALERRDADLRRELERVAGDERAAAARRDAATAALAQLDEAAASRTVLVTIAATEPVHTQAILLHEAERERQSHAERLRADIDRATQGLAGVSRELQRIGPTAESAVVPDWRWLPTDAADPIAAADRLIAVAEGQDAAEAMERAANLAACFRLVQRRNEARTQLDKYEMTFRGLERQRQELLAAGDPREALVEAQRARDAAVQAIQQAVSGAEQARETLAQLEPVVVSLRSQRFEDRCPTCARPFTAQEAEITLAALEDRLEALREKIARLDSQGRQEERRATAVEKTQRDAEKRQEELNTLDGRLGQGRPIVEDQRRLWDQAAQECAEALSRFGLVCEPTRETVDTAQARAEVLRRVAAAIPVLSQLRSTASGHVAELDAAGSALTALGVVAYDHTAHAAAQQALAEAREAAATIRQIDRDLARRPSVETERDQALAELVLLAQERSQIETARTDLAFDPISLAVASAEEQATLAAERAALEARSSKLEAHRDALAARDRLLEEIGHIARLTERADARNREADQLDVMYREFTLFEQYVARRITPQLAEHTSELLAAVTEGKYDRVEFTDNYGIEVYDGADEKFPMEEFSGGERDVIALSARLALSRLIGAQAHNPPGFLVLDEVFGALDRERRAQVLETLGALAGTADAFHQLFIISHVDDVRTAPIFNEIWRIAETGDGVSSLENLTETGGIEDV
ncbi:MAG: repair protein SbcC/Rad50 [Thermomicrobiales bacterium]|nr:repair protein SbcC/Rad50 [Thermomicrobiales bacterium]